MWPKGRLDGPKTVNCIGKNLRGYLCPHNEGNQVGQGDPPPSPSGANRGCRASLREENKNLSCGK